jgi:hypothetical protein
MLCLVLSSLTGFSAFKHALELSQISELKNRANNIVRFPTEKEKDLILFARIDEAQLSALEPLRDSRTLIMGALSVACAFVFVSAGRVLQPGGLSLERVRRMLGGANIAAALLRTIDGAQEAVVAKRLGLALANILLDLPEIQSAPHASNLKATLPVLALVITVGMTVVIAGTFAVLGQYFRSERVREAVLAQEGNLAKEED